MAKTSSEKIYADLCELSEKYNPQFVFVLCAIAIKESMGLANWKSYISQSFNDPAFQKLIVGAGYIPSEGKNYETI